MAILEATDSFEARHGSFDMRTSRYVVAASVSGPIENGFVAGVDSRRLKDGLSTAVACLQGRYLDDVVGRATNENIGRYLFHQLRTQYVSEVGVSGDGHRAVIQKADMDHEKYPARLTYERARSLLYRGMPDDALAVVTEAISLDGAFAPAYNLRGRCMRAKELWAEALPDFKRAAELDPSFGEAFRNMGNALLYTGQTTAMLEPLSRAIALMPASALAVNNRGFAYQRLGEWEAALEDHRLAIALDPNYAEAHSDCATALRELGRRDEAARLEEIAHELRAKGKDTFAKRVFY